MDLHEDSEQDEHLLFVDIDQVFPDAENDSSEFPSDRNGIFGVVFLVLIVGTLKNIVPVNSSWFDGSAKMNNISRVHALILQVGNMWDLLFDHVVCPFTKLSVSLATDKAEVVGSDELPDKCESKFSVLLGNIDTTDSYKLEFHVFSTLYDSVIVDISIEITLWSFVDFLPVNNFIVDFMHDLGEDESIVALFKDIINVDIFNFEGVHPDAEGSLLFGTFDVIIKESGSIVLFLGKLLKTVLGVEDLTDEKGVNFGISGSDIGGRDDIWDSKSQRISDHLLSS